MRRRSPPFCYDKNRTEPLKLILRLHASLKDAVSGTPRRKSRLASRPPPSQGFRFSGFSRNAPEQELDSQASAFLPLCSESTRASETIPDWQPLWFLLRSAPFCSAPKRIPLTLRP
jgi:hypothetical protein